MTAEASPERGAAGNATGAASAPAVVLPLLAVTQFLMTVDTTVMNVSISALVQDLGTDVASVQGVITVYTLVMAASMITGGKLGDILGRRRALRIGLVVYACGSAVTAISPNVVVLLFGWSILEGLGAALIMPTIVSLIAGNFTGNARAAAYSTIAAAAAVAAAAGPIIGGFVTSQFSWRWVFAAEVLIAAGILVLTTKVPDAQVEGDKPRLDLMGAALSASGLALVVLGVLQSSSWGWIAPKVTNGPDATPAVAGISLTALFVLGGFLLLWCFTLWLRRKKRLDADPLIDPDLFGNRQLKGGLVLIGAQYLITNGVFFTIPLFLSIVLGLSSFETGLRMLPLSVALIVVAPAIPKLRPNASPRRVVRAGLLLLAAATALLAVLLGQVGVGPESVTVPFLLMGAGLGMLASQLGNVIVSSEPADRSGEVGGLQYTAQNLGGSLGTALIGAVVIGSLTSLLVAGISSSEAIDDELEAAATTALTAGADFVSDEQLSEALSDTELTNDEQDAIVDANAAARIGALQQGMVAASLLALLALFFTARVPKAPLAAPGDPDDDVEPSVPTERSANA
jgi:EmrB/QacA subfamily drug resistance transporter